MSSYAQLDISVDTYCDYVQPIVLLGDGDVFIGLTVTSAQMTIRATPQDVAPIVQVTTASGLSFGVAPPAPVGAQCANLYEVLDLPGPPIVQNTPPCPILVTVANLTALASASTTGLTMGQFAFVTAGIGSYYAWSPGDPNTPNGTTIVASTGSTAGNWLLAVTVQIQIPQLLLLPLVGIAQAAWDLLVTWPNGTISKIFQGRVFVDQSIGGH